MGGAFFKSGEMFTTIQAERDDITRRVSNSDDDGEERALKLSEILSWCW